MVAIQRSLVVAVAALLFLSVSPAHAADKTGDAADRSAADAPASSTPAAPPSDAAKSSASSNIEDSSLEGLLDLNLEDKLGKTEAVSRTSESVLRAPAAMTTIDALELRLSGATTVPDALRAVPGVSVVRNAPGNYVVSLRGTGGLASNNVVLLIDGIPLNSPMNGTVSWDLIPIHVEDIERIEVVRGPVSPIYGANAYTGVINIVTRTTVGLTPSYVARVRAGADTDGGILGSVSGRFVDIGKKFRWKAFLRADHDGTFVKPADSGDPNVPPLNRVGGTTEVVFLPNESSQLAFEGGYVWSRRSAMDHLSLDSDAQTQQLVFARALYEVRPALPLSTVRLWAQGISIAIPADDDKPAGFSYEGSRSTRGAAGADLVLTISQAFSATAGGQGSLELIRAPFVHPNVDGHARPFYGFYAGLKAEPLASLDLIVTGRGDLSPLSAKVEYSYRASAIVHADTWGLRLTGASAFRSPTYIEAAGRFVDPISGLILLEGTDTIQAPRNTSIEMGATFAPVQTLTLSGTVYYSRLSNLMSEDFDSVVRRTFENDPSARTLIGGELEAKWRVADAISVLPSFAAMHWQNAGERVDTNVGVPAQNPRYLAGLRVQGLFGGDTWGYGLGATYSSSRSYDIRSGIPPVILRADLPATARISGMLEHQLVAAPSLWASIRLGATLPKGALESPLPFATPLGQSAILGVEVRRE